MSHNPRLINPYQQNAYTQENDYNLYGELSTQHDNTIALELSRNKAGQILKKTGIKGTGYF